MTRDRTNVGEIDEPSLVRRVQQGDVAAFEILVERYLDPGFVAAIAVLGNSHDAEDAVQNAFIRALERIDQLQPGSPFGPWFYRVLRSTALNLRRRESLRAHDEIPASASARSNPARNWTGKSPGGRCWRRWRSCRRCRGWP